MHIAAAIWLTLSVVVVVTALAVGVVSWRRAHDGPELGSVSDRWVAEQR
jgi:hypothetical protein